MKEKRRLFGAVLRGTRIMDWLIIAVSIAVVVFSGAAVYSDTGGTPTLIIESPKGQWIYDLEKSTTVGIKGSEGITTVIIRDGTAFISDSPCLNHTCVAAQPIGRPGEWIACMPNQVFMRIEGKSPDDTLDVIGF